MLCDGPTVLVPASIGGVWDEQLSWLDLWSWLLGPEDRGHDPDSHG